MAILVPVPRAPHVAKLIRFPPEVYEQFEAALKRERRSVTAQVVWLIEQWLAQREREERARDTTSPAAPADHG